MPMRPEEREKKSNNRTTPPPNNIDDGNTEDITRGWKKVAGGFVPKFLRRGGSGTTKEYTTNDDDNTTTDNTDTTTTTAYPIQMVDTLEDYKRVVVDDEDSIVVVRFFAPWCKSCKAAMPLFKKMVSEHSSSSSGVDNNVKFVQVPLTKETAYIHEGLGVPSVPFGHIYYPKVGLVEEKKINKKVFKEFREALDSYVLGYCDLPIIEEEDDESSRKFEDKFNPPLLIDDDGFQ